MDVILGSELAAIVVSPREAPILIINHIYKATPHLNLANSVFKFGLQVRLVIAILKEGSESLDGAKNARVLLVMFDESVS